MKNKISILEVMQPRQFQINTESGTFTLPYRIYVPAQSDKKRTLILFLHGAGERGTDNQRHIECNNQFLQRYRNSEYAHTHPAVILAPQCPNTWADGTEALWCQRPWANGAYDGLPEESVALQAVVALCKETIKEYNLDAEHSVVTGISMGGFGTWDLISRHPGLFFKALPVCGGGSVNKEDVTRIVESGVQIWTFHGNADDIVPVKGTRDMVAAIKNAGGQLKYTEYAGVTHGSWEPAYHEEELLAWIFDF